MKPSVFITRNLPGKLDEKLAEDFSVEIYDKDHVMPREELLKKIKGKDAVLTLLTDKVDAEFFDAAGPNLKIVANYAVGFDNINIKEATSRGIMVSNTPGVLTEAVAEHTWALILSVARRVIEADEYTRAGKYKEWKPSLYLGQQLEGKTFGVIGLGRIGTWVAQRAKKGFEMNVVYHNRSRKPDFEKQYEAKYLSLNELLKQADVISLHVPATPETRHMISWEEFELMKKSAILINTSRGPIIREKPLVNALETRQIWGAGLDVFEQEIGIEKKHLDPLDWKKLVKFKNVVLTPHIASATVEARQQMSKLAVTNIRQALTGKKPDNLLNPKVKGRG